MAVQARPQIEAYIGMTGSGKGVSITRRLRALKPARMIVWDPRGEYAEWAPHAAPTLPALVEQVMKAGQGPMRARYVHDGRVDIEQAFGVVCRLAFEAGNCVLLAEELSDVTKPSYAPPAWRRCLTQGRHKGLHIIGATQRPALIDKTFLGNCTRIRACCMAYADDRRAMAKELDVAESVLAGLTTQDTENGARIEYVERERRPPSVVRGVITIKAGKVSELRGPVRSGAT